MTTMAFVSTLVPISSAYPSSHDHICGRGRTHVLLRKQIPGTQVRPVATAVTMKKSAADAPTLKSKILASLEGLNRGLDVDPDSDVMTKEESQLETLIERLEDMNQCELPTKDTRMSGTWELLYTSSTLTRYFGGVTGLQRFFPDGCVESIRQVIDLEDGTASLEEDIEFDVPFVDKRATVTAIFSGSLQALSEFRQIWDAKTVRMSFFSWFADGWKTVRAFKILDTTYLDHDMRVTRGQTGSVCLFTKSNTE